MRNLFLQEERFMGKVEWLKASAKKAYHYYRRNGLRAVISAISERLQQEAGAKYVYEMPSEEILTKQRAAALSWLNAPFLSVVVPAYETPEQYLMELLESMKRQTYPNWELVLADASSSEKVDRTLQRFLEENDQLSDRIRLIRLPENRGISHMDIIDLSRENISGFDVREFYVKLVNDLKNRGL